jgi:Ser/Thr protein kinase RdoA (MazF antagonist)
MPAVRIQALGEGHIHETWLVQLADTDSQLVLQQVNTHVFADVAAVMENITRVTAHARARLAQAQSTGAAHATDLARRVLTLRRTHAGAAHWSDSDGRVFRAFDYIAGSLTLSRIENTGDAYEAGRAVGEFAGLMADLPAPPLHTTLPDFHAPAQRYLQLRAAMAQDAVGRAAAVQAEWQALTGRESLALECASWAQDPGLVVRVVHNDTKLNNILFDATTRRALCMIDLDTVMPGYLAFDFGDLVRTCVFSEAEDSRALERVHLRFEVFEALTRGFLSELAGRLTPLEHRSLARGPLWFVLELALRFLADYVNGDRYFKIAHPEHNLERARMQLRLLTELETHASELARILEACR